jgi:hypothetical protein
MIAAAIGTSVESVATAAVETSTSSAAVTAAMLGKRGYRRNSEEERCDSCEKSFQQGGLLHFSSFHPKRRFRAREGEPQPRSYPIWTPIPNSELSNLNKKPVLRAIA